MYRTKTAMIKREKNKEVSWVIIVYRRGTEKGYKERIILSALCPSSLLWVDYLFYTHTHRLHTLVISFIETKLSRKAVLILLLFLYSYYTLWGHFQKCGKWSWSHMPLVLSRSYLSSSPCPICLILSLFWATESCILDVSVQASISCGAFTVILTPLLPRENERERNKKTHRAQIKRERESLAQKCEPPINKCPELEPMIHSGCYFTWRDVPYIGKGTFDR